MTFSYSRKSKFNLSDSIQNVKKGIDKAGLKFLGEIELKDNKGSVIYFSNGEWVDKVVSLDKNLLGFIPSAVIVSENDGTVSVGATKSSVLGGVAQNEEIFHLSVGMEKILKDLVNQSSGAPELKPSQIKLYATMSCPYCKMEKAWLDENKVQYEEIFVDQDKSAAEEMVKKTGQMGVPVTEIQYEDSDADFIVGFDRPQLAELLNIKI